MFYTKLRARWHAILLLSAFLPVHFISAEPLSAEADESAGSLSLRATHTAVTLCQLPTSLTSEALVELALNCSFNQQALAARLQAQQYQIEIAGSHNDPKLMLGIAPQTFGDERFDDGYIVELSQLLPWPGVLSLREQVAGAKADVWQARFSQDQVVLARDVRLSFAQWQYHHQILAINERHQQLWQEFIAIVNAKYAAGINGKSAVLQATHEHHLLLQEEIELKSAIERDASQIKQLLNLPSHIQLKPQDVIRDTPASLPEKGVTLLLSRLDQQPVMQGAKAQQRQKDNELALAEKDRYPTFSAMTRYNSLWMNDEQRWVIGVSVNLPFDFGKRSSREDSLRAEQNALRWEQQDLRVQLREQLVRAHSFWQQAIKVEQLYLNELLPLAEENMVTARNEYQSGAGDFLSLLTAQRQLLATERKAQMAARNQITQFARLTAAAGLVRKNQWNVALPTDSKRRQP